MSYHNITTRIQNREIYQMDTAILKKIGLSENEIKVYLFLLANGKSTAYDIGKKISIYRVHVYDKLEQLIRKGMVTHINIGPKKYFHATNPKKIMQYIEDKRKYMEFVETELSRLIPELESLEKIPKEDTSVEVFEGNEGLKYILKDIIQSRSEVLLTGIDDKKYSEALPVFMKQYFRDLKRYKIHERIITQKKKGIFVFDKNVAPTTNYRFLETMQFNPTNTFIYSNKIVIVIWGTPVTAIMVKNKGVANTYRNHFEYLWKIASKEI